MTYLTLISTLAKRTNTNKARSRVMIEELAAIVAENMAAGEKTDISGFGTFILGHRAARHGVHPTTGDDIRIPAMAAPKFRFSGKFSRRFR